MSLKTQEHEEEERPKFRFYLMNANLYGFENGNDFRWSGPFKRVIDEEGCFLGVYESATAKYGEGTYGPRGSLIDTNLEFHLSNEFDAVYDEEW